MDLKIPNFEVMSDQEFDEWFTKASKMYAESIVKEIENDPNFKNSPGLSPEAYENLMKRVEELEKNG